MDKTKLFLIQLNAIMFIVGYFLMHSVLSVVADGGTRAASIVYDAAQLGLSIYVISICHKDLFFERNRSLLLALSVTMVLYTVRMLLDVVVGPFSSILPQWQMLNDVLLTVCGIFFPTWAMLSSRRWINLQYVCMGIFFVGLATCIFVLASISMHGISFEEERVAVGRGLHSLALAKLGAIEFLVAIHMFMTESKRKFLYIFGCLMGGG